MVFNLMNSQGDAQVDAPLQQLTLSWEERVYGGKGTSATTIAQALEKENETKKNQYLYADIVSHTQHGPINLQELTLSWYEKPSTGAVHKSLTIAEALQQQREEKARRITENRQRQMQTYLDSVNQK